MGECRAASLDDLVLKRAKRKDPARAIMENLKNYEAALEQGDDCRAPLLPPPSFKGQRVLAAFDCAAAPCRDACAIGQDVSRYMHWVELGDADRAKAVVWETNPLPATCGMVCDQKCQDRCTRGLFDRPLAIRAVKRFVVENGSIPAADPASLGDATRVAVVGAGPAGLAAARELTRGGFWVEVFEAGPGAGGLAATVIPGFRLAAAALDDDVARLKEKGVIFHFDQAVDGKRLAGMLDSFHLVFLAAGAGKGRRMLIPEEDAVGVHDALEFLSAAKRGETPDIGRQVVVIGGGNSAMDAARTARRLCGAEGRVTVIYRRRLSEMPAAAEEIREALAEGVRIMELTAPLRIEVAAGREWALLCSRMELRKADSSGRPHPVPVFGSEFELTCDAVIVAIGQERNAELLADTDWQVVGNDGGTSHPRLFVVGDARGGPSTLVRAIADGCQAVDRIMEESGRTLLLPESGPVTGLTWPEQALKRSRRERAEPLSVAPAAELSFAAAGLFMTAPGLDAKAARHEAKRCFHCDDLCQLCIGVCPNRALVAFEVKTGRWPVLARRAPQGRGRAFVGRRPGAEPELPAGPCRRLLQRLRQLRHVLPHRRRALQGQAPYLPEPPGFRPGRRRLLPQAPGPHRRQGPAGQGQQRAAAPAPLPRPAGLRERQLPAAAEARRFFVPGRRLAPRGRSRFRRPAAGADGHSPGIFTALPAWRRPRCVKPLSTSCASPGRNGRGRTTPSSRTMTCWPSIARCRATSRRRCASCPTLACRLGLGEVFVKDEAQRFGIKAFKALGASYAMYRFLKKRWQERFVEPFTPACFQDKEALAKLGCLHLLRRHRRQPRPRRGLDGAECSARRRSSTCPPIRSRRGWRTSAARGPRWCWSPAPSTTASRRCAADAAKNGWQAISDTAYPGYREIPGWILLGYTTIFAELEGVLHGPRRRRRPGHPAGRGGGAGRRRRLLL